MKTCLQPFTLIRLIFFAILSFFTQAAKAQYVNVDIVPDNTGKVTGIGINLNCSSYCSGYSQGQANIFFTPAPEHALTNVVGYRITNSSGNQSQINTTNGSLGTQDWYYGGQLTATFYAAPSEIDVRGNDISIPSGDVTPTVNDNTHFGVQLAPSGSHTRLFRIYNTGIGALGLSGNPRVSITGANASDFQVTTQPSSDIVGGNSSIFFIITFTPSGLGTRTATVTINNSDSNEGTYTFNIAGIGVNNLPNINIVGKGQDIPHTYNGPSTDNDTDFGSRNIGAGPVVKTFTIENTGTGTLDLSTGTVVLFDGTGAADFSLASPPSSSSIAPNGSTTFQVAFNPSVVGSRNATVYVNSFAPTEHPYYFSIRGTGLEGCTQVASATQSMSWNGSVSNDWTNPCNWTPNGVPTQTNPVSIQSGGTVVIPSGTTATAKSITLNGSFSNRPSLTINQNAALRMGSTESTVTKFEMVQYATVTNNGLLILETSGGSGVNSTFEMGFDDNVFHNYGSVVINSTNSTPIQIGNTGSNGPSATFNNYACASFANYSGGMLLNTVGSSFFNNAGMFRTVGNLGAVGTFTNQSGGVAFIGGTLTHNQITSNTGSVRVNRNASATTMFTYTGTYAGTIEIFTDAGLSNSAGTYNQANNTFTPANTLPAGSVPIFIKITSTANSCSYVVPNTFQNGCAQVATSTENMGWNGSVNSDWTNPCNWTPNGVPGAGNVVLIPTATVYPTISTGINATAKQVYMTGNASLTVGTGASLTVQNNAVALYLQDNAQFINRGTTTITNTNATAQNQGAIQLAVSTTALENYGTLNANGNQNYGMYAVGTFNNKTGATLTASGYRGGYVAAGGKIINESNATINATGSNIGLVLDGQNTTSSNSGTINSSKIEIINATTFTNQNCGVIKITGNLDMSGNSVFNNYGYTLVGSDLGHYVATTNNYGVLKYNSLTGGVNNTTNSVVVNNTTPIFTFGATYNGTVNGIFTNEAATSGNSAGTYTQNTNTFTPSSSLPTGSQTLYAKITPNTGGCFYVVPFTFNNAGQPDYTISTSGNNLVITDLTGTGETLDITPNSTNIRFNVTGKTFSLNNGPTTNFPADVPLSSLASITVNTADGNDIINIGALGNNLPSLTIHGGTGDDQVNFNEDITFATNANLDVDLQNDDGSPGVDGVTFAINTNIVLQGTGAATLRVSKNVVFNNGSTLGTNNGNLTVEANQQTSPTAGNFIGVSMGSSTQLQVLGSGTLTVKGKGGNDASGSQAGILLNFGGVIYGGSNTVSVIGNGGASSGIGNYGIFIQGSSAKITSLGGAVTVEGTGGGTGSSIGNDGIRLATSGEITSAGTGAVTVTGRGGTAPTGINNVGVNIQASAKITSVGGAVTVNAYGGGSGASQLNYGLFMSQSGEISAGGTGTVTITGEGGTATGSSNHGIALEGLIKSAGGNIALTGKPGGGSTLTYGIYMSKQSGAPVSSITTEVSGGNIAITTNSLRIVDSPDIRTNSSGRVTLKPFTAGTAIEFSLAPDATNGPLILSDLELDRISTGTLVVGDATMGDITVGTGITRPTLTNMELISGGDVIISGGSINTNGGTLLLDPGTSPKVIKPTFNGTDVTVFTLTVGGDLDIPINGTTAGDGTGSTYSQLKVVGGVNLSGTNLVLSGTPALVGGETFVIVDNDGTEAVGGTFSNFAQGATLSNFLGSGRSATISYTGGTDNNDVVITVAAPAVPDINLKGNSQNIARGDNTPIITDHTDFGPVSVPSGSVTRTFTIENTGAGALTLGTITGGTTDFVITQPSLTSIPANGSTTFTVTFDPTTAGKRTATISIPSNDPDENPYTFAIEGYGGTPFITTWKTDNSGTSSSTSIRIPTTGTGYSYDVDWNNDGIYDELGLTGNVTHDYGTAGTYTVAIRGTFPRIYFNDAGDKAKLLAVTQWGSGAWTSMERAFAGCINLEVSATDIPDLANVTSTRHMFSGCQKLTGPNNIGSWNVGSVTDMGYMFAGCLLFNQAINGWDVRAVTTMRSLFFGATSFNQPLNGWQVGAVTTMEEMFSNADAFNGNIANWDVRNVTTFRRMFFMAPRFNQNIGSWQPTKALSTSQMFYGATDFNGNIGGWDVQMVNDMSGMFYGASHFNQDIGNWQVGAVTDMSTMFRAAVAFNQDISRWNVSKVLDMSMMFYGTTAFNQNISGWNVSTVTNMGLMFHETSAFNQDLSSWDIRAVTTLYGMFDHATAFNQSLSSWGAKLNTGVDLRFFLDNCGMSVANYDATLTGFSQSTLTSKEMGAAGLKYCAAAAARATLVGATGSGGKGWVITGDALSSTCTPDINLKGNNVSIVSGDNTPIITDHTDFGPVSVPSGSVTRTFTIENTGAVALTLGTITGGTTDFTITQPSLTSIPANSSTTFTVTFDPTTTGKRTTTISIPSNDSGSPYTFAIEGYGGKPFITTWQTDKDNPAQTSITIPTTGTGYSYDVDWNNDGIYDEFGLTGNVTHDYGTANTYTVAIRGAFPRIFFDNDGANNKKLLSVNQWGDIDWKSFERAFLGCDNLQINASDKPDLNDVTNMSRTFLAISAINQDISAWDVSSVENMSLMFSGVSSFNQNISNWNVSKVTNMARMFSATAFNQNISGWDVSKVTNMTGMFLGATAFDQNLAAWGTKFNASVDLTEMLSSCGMNVANYDATLIGFNQGTVTGRNLGATGLQYCTAQSARTNLTTNKGWTIAGDALSSTCAPEINLKGNSISIVSGDNSPIITDHTDFGPVSVPSGSVMRTFTIENTGAGALTLGTITGGTTDFVITQPSLTTVAVGSSTTFTVTFDPTTAGKRTATISIPSNDPDENPYTFAIEGYGGKPFVTTWKTDNSGTSSATSITIPTLGTGYNYDVDWNNDGIYDELGVTGSVTHNYGTAGTYTVAIRGDFPRIHFNSVGDASKLLTISQWGDIAWTSMSSAFNGCNNLSVTATDVPNLSGVTSLSSMFANCTILNGPANISTWNTSTITGMSRMFQEATSFNQDISNWDVSNVTNMSLMFQNATAFNQSLAAWGTKFNASVNLGNFLDNCGMNEVNYDATLIGFNQGTVTGRSLGALGLKYCTAQSARNNLITNKGWTITGDAQNIACTSPDYTITTTSGNIVITDAKGTGATLEVSENSGKIRFNVTGKTYNIDGGTTTAFTTPAEVVLSGKNSITVNTAGGNDIINVGAFTTQLPTLTINGGTGDDEVNLNGNITFVSNANLDLDLQNDDATAPGTDALSIAANAIVTLSGTGTATVKVSKNATINSGGSLQTQNGNLVVEANQQTTPSSGDFAGVDVNGGSLKVTGSGQTAIKGKSGVAGYKAGVSVSNGGIIEGGTAALSVTGTGGTAAYNENIGVLVTGTNSKITSLGGNVSVVGQGDGMPGGYNQHGVAVKSSGMITAGGTGTVTVQGTGASQTDGYTFGVHLNAGTITSSGGNVSVTGQGGGSNTANHGIYLESSGLISAGGVGTVTVQGSGGSGTNGYHQGVFLKSSAITSTNGHISVTGQAGGASTSSANTGVLLDATSRIAAGGTGNVTVQGTGSSSASTASFNYGLQLSGSNSQISTNNGNIRLIGQGGQGANGSFNNSTGNTGIGLSGKVLAGGTGTIYIEGTGANQSFSDGVEVDNLVTTNDGTITIIGVGGADATASNGSVGVDLNGTVTAGNGKAINIQGTAGSSTGPYNQGVYIRRTVNSTSGGAITITGIEGGSGVGIEIESLSGGQITTASMGGNISLITNSIDIKNTAVISTNSASSVILRPYTNGVNIDLGAATNLLGGPLSLSDDELDRITAGTLQIGDANSGAITISAPISRAAATNVNLTTAGAVNLNASALAINGGNLAINAAGGINPTVAGTDVNVGTVSFASGNDLAIAINGTTADTDYRQLNVAGSVNLSGLDLVLSGSHVPVLGQTFVIVNNDGSDAIQGTFNGLPEGSTIAPFLGGQLNARISYVGGDGNDAVLTVIASVELPANTANVTICKNATASLTASCKVGQVTWYNAAGTTQLFVGSPLVTPALTASTSYKVRCELAPQLSGFVDVMVTVVVPPTITLTTLQQTLNEGNNPVLCDTDANPVNGLQFNVTGLCVSGSPVWRVQVGSGAWSNWSATAPVSQSSNNQPHRYQAACDANCASTYSGVIELTINNRASVPQNVSLLVDGVTVAVGETKEVCSLVNMPLTFNANCATGEVILYSVDGGEYSAGVPVGLVDNQYHNYRVRCRKSDGTPSCVESESGVMRLKLVTIPSAPTVSLPSTSSCNPSASFSGQSTCGSLRTVWYNATTNVALPSLPSTVPSQTTSYYARCQTENGCVSDKSNVVTFTLTPTQVAPVITASQEIVCTGTTVTISANCPAGSQTFWNTGVTAPSFEVAFSNVTKQTYWAKCLFDGGCQSSESIRKDIYWNAFVVTLINIGESKSAVKPANDKSLWSSQFITRDGGPELDQSTQVNPTLFYVENANKMAPRYWTINVEACGLSTDGSLTFDMLATPEMGVIRSFNTHENNAPYFMYANREGWTELYAQNHPAYGFYQDNGVGGNVYDTGLPKGLYKLGIRYWDQKGWGSIYPATRQPQGNVLAYQEYWFRIQSKDGVGVGAARTAESEEANGKGQGARGEGQEANGKWQGSDNGKQITDNGSFATVLPNPVTNILRLKVQDGKAQTVQAALTDASGREIVRRQFVPETNTHQEEFGVSELPAGMYFLKVTTPEKQATLKVVKVN
ncbi:surface protein [Runella defluvii]|uniref:Surface protein n=1 Tax=Runella defluvii TaxID=370973 RepID=A0A7W5ZHM2_9BACT|nr:BspA family leucine-rich repeat surface protein [Runella defluvii]MBB3836022.1 surface protein [Runella defluvii]